MPTLAGGASRLWASPLPIGIEPSCISWMALLFPELLSFSELLLLSELIKAGVSVVIVSGDVTAGEVLSQLKLELVLKLWLRLWLQLELNGCSNGKSLSLALDVMVGGRAKGSLSSWEAMICSLCGTASLV